MVAAEQRVLLIGASGQLGTDLRSSAAGRRLALVAVDHDGVDVTDAASVSRAIDAARPDLVINVAAFTNVDRCEDESEHAFAVNAAGALNVAEAAAAHGARTVHVSTDYVFDGTKAPPNAYAEEDEPAPLNVYGASKLAGERHVLSADPRALVVRSSSLFGVAGARGKGGNFVEAILRRAKAGEALAVVADQFMTPTYTRDLAGAILDLIASGTSGLVHVASPVGTTWFEFAKAIVAAVGFEVPVRPTTAAEYGAKARRPANSALATDRLESILGRRLRPWPEALHAYLLEKGHL